MLKQTHTFSILSVTRRTWDEIAGLLRAADYDHAFSDINEVIDMNGIALAPHHCVSNVAGCNTALQVRECGATMCPNHGHIETCSQSDCPYFFVGLRIAVDAHALDCKCELCFRYVYIRPIRWTLEQVKMVETMLNPFLRNQGQVIPEPSAEADDTLGSNRAEEFRRNFIYPRKE
jgi:hypothetical protein